VRLLAVLVALPIVLLGAVVVGTNVLRPPPAADRLTGVTVALAGYRLAGTGADRRLEVSLRVTSPRDIDECMAFALDLPFRGRRMAPTSDGCVRPRSGAQDVTVVLTELTEDDERFPDHVVVWGIQGGRCGPILELVGVCVVDQAGTLDLALPRPSGLPAFPFGSFPLGSFPLFSFEPLP
jgi:hypothetical protein